MPGTKIINVLRDDRLEDILNIFRKTPAEEVIFVLPKKTKAFAKESSFATLADESQELGKNVLFLTENKEMNALAAQYDFAVLSSSRGDHDEEEEDEPVKSEDAVEANPIDGKADEDGNEDSENFSPLEPIEYQEEPVSSNFEGDAVLAAIPKRPQSMTDIMQPKVDNSISVKVNKKVEKPVPVEVKKDMPDPWPHQDMTEKTALDEIESVWTRRETPISSKPVQRPVRAPQPAPFQVNRYNAFQPPRSPFSVRAIFTNLSKRTLYIYGLAVVVIFGFVLYVSTGKAEITIKPRAHALDFNVKVMASDEFLAVDAELKRIPGQLFSVEKKIEESFPSTGEKDVVQKARGKITVYNEYGTTLQVLIATTRFESENGLIFRTLKTVTVPGTTVQNGKVSPGKIDVEVIADKAGGDYNVGPGRFTVPAFKEKGDMDRYGKFYGQSSEAMKGGIIGKAKVVTEQDYINAKKKIEERIIAETEQELKTQASGLKILSLSKPNIKEITPSAQIDEAIDSFTVVGVVELKTVGFKDSDLNELIVQYVQKINDVAVFPEKLTIRFEDVKFNEEKKALEFTVFVVGPAYSKINEEKLITDLMGKGEDSITDYIKGVEGISSARVKLSPFWVWKVPKGRERIHIKMEYE